MNGTVDITASLVRYAITRFLENPLGWTVVATFAIILARSIYNVYLHPLAKFPGPWMYRASSIPVAIAQIRGNFHEVTKAAHDKYGHVVRMAPNELCYISQQSIADIFGRQNGQFPLPKDRTFFNDMLLEPGTLTNATEEEHPRLRHMIAPAFSPRALQEQEPILKKNVDLLISQMRKRADLPAPVDLKAWYNYASFDMVGDFAFGQSFGSLAISKPHEWVQFILDYIQAGTYLHVAHRFYPLNKLLTLFVPKSMLAHKERHCQMALDMVQRRIESPIDRKDFVHYMLQSVGGTEKVTTRDVEKQANILILAGSDSVAILLSFATYFLIQRPSCMARLKRELHDHFSDEGDIGSSSLDQLPYLQAVVQETLRIRHPFPNGFGREVRKEGSIVGGQFLPPTTVVNIHPWSLFQCEAYFKHPNYFAPERWQGDEDYQDDAKEIFQPFFVGPRNCIGQRFALNTAKLILARMVWNFDLALSPETQQWLEKQPAFVSWDTPPLLVHLKTAQNKM